MSEAMPEEHYADAEPLDEPEATGPACDLTTDGESDRA